MSWNAAPPPDLPAPGPADRLRLAWRAPAAALWLALMFGVFQILRGADAAAARISGGSAPALAPPIVGAWARGALAILGIRRRVRGAPMAHPGALVANHASWLDIVVLQATTRAAFVSKAEVAGWPGIGAIGRAIGTVFIERRATEAQRQTATLAERLAHGDRLVIFPEGTSSDGRQVLPFKSALFGVFLAPGLKDRLWVQPVTLAYREGPGLPPAFYGWWGDMDFAAHLRAMLAFSRGGSVEAVFHPPLRAADFSDRKALAEAAAAAVTGAHAALAEAAGRIA